MLAWKRQSNGVATSQILPDRTGSTKPIYLGDVGNESTNQELLEASGATDVEASDDPVGPCPDDCAAYRALIQHAYLIEEPPAKSFVEGLSEFSLNLILDSLTVFQRTSFMKFRERFPRDCLRCKDA